MKPVHTEILPLPKVPLTLEEKSCLVNKVSCLDSDFVYIGQTKRDPTSSLAKHNLAIKNQKPKKTTLYEHFIQFDHLIGWNITRKF